MISRKSIALFLAALTSTSIFADSWKELPDQTDPMSTDQSFYVTSPAITSLSALRFPYSDVHSWVGVGCNTNGDYWAFIGFTDKNFVGGKRVYGKTEHYTKIKYDDDLKTIHFTEADNGRNFLDVIADDKRTFLNGVMQSNKIITGVKWYGHSDVWFEYSMKGSTKAIESIFKKCKIVFI